MSALLGVFPPLAQPAAAPSVSETVLARMMGRMARRGTERVGYWREGGVGLGVGRHAWELTPGYSGPVLVVQDRDVAVAADATLYYRDDLRRALAARGVRPSGQTPGHLILAAYQAWGTSLAEHLEGDFAFVLYDRRGRRVVAARDFTGSRPLYHATLGDGTLVIASAIAAIEAHPDYAPGLDLTELAMDAGGLLLSLGDATCHAGVARLNGGRTLVRGPGGGVTTRAHWEPPCEPARNPTPFEDAADELRELLGTAVTERLAPDAPSAVWMSGGWDSTAIFGAGRDAQSRAGDARQLLPISLRLADDDPECETHFIEAVAGRWRAPVRWLDLPSIPIGIDATSGSGRDEPWCNTYQGTHRALAAATREAGARVAMIGHGGDLLFACSRVLAADLLRAGRLGALAREWRHGMHGDVRELLRWAVLPLLPAPLVAAAGRVRGRPVSGIFERPVPRWFRDDFVARHGLRARAAEGSARAPGGSRSGYEIAWLLSRAHMARSCAEQELVASDAGLHTRWPLMDPRVITFAATRPGEERRLLHERKRLLRRAMRGVLPDEVLEPRPFKTGTMGSYFTAAFQQLLPLLADVARAPLLADLGIVEPARLRRAIEIAGGPNSNFSTNAVLLTTLQAELWLRARDARAEPAEPLPLPAFADQTPAGRASVAGHAA